MKRLLAIPIACLLLTTFLACGFQLASSERGYTGDDYPNPTVKMQSSIETYEVSVRLPVGDLGYINVLIPPDASVVSAELLGTSGLTDLTDFRYAGTFNLRCYRFAQIYAEYEGWSESAKIDIRVQVSRNSVSYVSCESDALTEKIIERLMLCPISGDVLPGLSFGNLENAGEWKGYPILSVDKESSYQLAEQNVDYLVIAKGGIDLNDFLNWKKTQGFNTYVVTTQEIDYYYSGSTLQSKTREFLKDAFNTWHMKYVLIVGGPDTLPPINYQVYQTTHGTDDRTTDYYYITLEQSADTFSFDWSEHPCVDFPDFVLGRFPSDDSQEIQNMVQKTISYEQTTSLGEWVRTNLLVVGEDAPGGATSSWEQYTADDRPKLKLVYPENLTLQALVNVLSQGVGSACMNAHASPYGWALGGGESLDYMTVDSLSNSRLPVVFSCGCHSGKFDAQQSVAVKMLGKSTGGAVAIVAGTSYTPYGDDVYFSAYNYWGNCTVDQWRLPNADYHVGKAFFYFTALNTVEYMILLGDPSLVLATANYDPINTPPILTLGSVSPGSGTSDTTFTYEITYTDADGDAPPYMRVYIDGSSHTMSKVSGTYMSGATYCYTTSSLSSGSHTYSFQASDGTDMARFPSSGISSGPNIIFEVTLTFRKSDGSALANTTIYYGTSEGAEMSVLGTTDSEGKITSTNSAIAGKTMYFESSDGKYAGSVYITTSGGEVSLTLTETTKPVESPITAVAGLVVVICFIVIMWKFLAFLKKRKGNQKAYPHQNRFTFARGLTKENLS